MKGFVNLTQTNDSKINKIITNDIVIARPGGGFNAGVGAKGSGVAIGKSALAGSDCVGIGDKASASISSIAIGKSAVSNGDGAVQIGGGYNYEPGTLKFRDFNIVSKDGRLYTNSGTESNVIMIPVASEQFVKDMLGGVAGGGLTLQVVDVLPTEEISTTTIYLVPNSSGTHDEYIYVNDTWEQIGTTDIDLSNYVTIEEYNKLVNNTTLIASSTGAFKAGTDASGSGIAIGREAKADHFQSTSIGWNSRASQMNNVAVGTSAKATGAYSIQLGSGSNSNDNTLQIFDKNIYNHSTDTLTVQNIELNGENLADKLGGGSTITNVTDTITTDTLSGVVNLSEAQYQELVKNGSITLGDKTLTYSDTAIYVTSSNPALNTLTLSGGSVLTSTEAFTSHVQILVEFETDSIHAGFDCVLHPYDEAVCFVTYNVLVNGQPNFGTAYLDDAGHVVVNVPSGLTFSNIHAKYVVYGG